MEGKIFKIKVEGNIKYRWNDRKLTLNDKFGLVSKRLSNIADQNIRKGDNPMEIEYIISGRKRNDIIITTLDMYLEKVEMTEMLDVPEEKFRIMKSEVTVGMFRQFMNSGYEISGDNADRLKGRLEEAARDEYLTDISLLDGRALAQFINEHNGSKLRIPTKYELSAANNKIGKELYGNYYEWTETSQGGVYCTMALCNSYPDSYFLPGRRHGLTALRFVEDK